MRFLVDNALSPLVAQTVIWQALKKISTREVLLFWRDLGLGFGSFPFEAQTSPYLDFLTEHFCPKPKENP